MLSSNLPGRSLYDFVALDDRDAVRASMDAALQSSEPTHVESRVVAQHGRDEQWIAWTNSVQREQGGKRSIRSVGRDVTEYRRAIAALQTARESLERAGELAQVGGWELNVATGAMRWSERMRAILEVWPDFEPTAENTTTFFDDEGRLQFRQAIRQARETREPFDLELNMLSCTGRRLCVRTIGRVYFDDAGEPTRLVGALQDITTRKKLELELQGREKFLVDVTDKLPIQIAYFNRHLRCEFANKEHCARLGLTREHVIGHEASRLLGGPQ